MFKWMWLRYCNEMDEGLGGAGGGEVPPAEPPSAEPADPAEESLGESVNWGGLADELEEEDSVVEGDLEVAEPEVKEVAPPAAEPQAPPEATEPQTPPAAAVTEAPAPAAPTPAPVPTASTEEYSAWRSARLAQLEELYAVDEESATALLTEPEKVLPALAAKVHMEVLENSMRAMQAMVPVMMQQVTQHTEVNNQARNLFVGMNPDLADPSLEPTILKLGTVYRSVNPTAPAPEAARAIGNLVRAALGIAAPQAQAPAAPVQQSQAAPFTPARGAGGGSRPAVPSNPFEQLAAEMENEDW